MPTILSDWIKNQICLGEMSVHKELAIIPLFIIDTRGPAYISLKTALENGLTIREVSEGGSVPELKLVNPTPHLVLIIFGEELAGAKQNRVLNTSILVAPESELVIPVSCTEHGRWSYQSREFMDSDVCMAPSLRIHKNRSVSHSLKASGQHRSNQMEVWDSIAELHNCHQTESRTSAMKDAYERKRTDIGEYRNAFPCRDRQCGLVVLIHGTVVGLEMVSRPDVYQQLHDKLIDSYSMDIPMPRPDSNETNSEKILEILEDILTASEDRFPAVGMGKDLRYMGKKSVGSALLVEDQVIHAAVFQISSENREGEHPEKMASFHRRRGFMF